MGSHGVCTGPSEDVMSWSQGVLERGHKGASFEQMSVLQIVGLYSGYGHKGVYIGITLWPPLKSSHRIDVLWASQMY